MTSEHFWPGHFPVGCPSPPHDCRPGVYYRLVVDSDMPKEVEFLPHAERPGYAPSGGRGARCSDCALSVFDSVESALNFVAARPAVSAKHPVPIRANDEGVIHGDSLQYVGHFLWWLPRGKSFFEIYRSENHA
jgi:hypothetical protein